LDCFSTAYLRGERFVDSPSLEKARKKAIQSYYDRLEAIAQPHRRSGISVTLKVQWDHPLHEGIVRHAALINADLVLKDTHYHSSIARALLSNTDWQLIRNCGSPLWLVKAGPLPEPLIFLASIDPMNEHDKPAALDDRIIVFARALAVSCDGDVQAFHAYDPRAALATASVNSYLPVSLPYDEIAEHMRHEHGARFREITEYHGIDVTSTHLVAGRAEDELPELARRLPASVVVMGAVARNRWQRLFIGATAERVLDHLPCDLLIIKPDWFKVPAEILHPKEGGPNFAGHAPS
jgi:universal stress protein E